MTDEPRDPATGRLQDPWWAGVGDARARRPYHNPYISATARYEYAGGYTFAGGRVPAGAPYPEQERYHGSR